MWKWQYVCAAGPVLAAYCCLLPNPSSTPCVPPLCLFSVACRPCWPGPPSWTSWLTPPVLSFFLHGPPRLPLSPLFPFQCNPHSSPPPPAFCAQPARSWSLSALGTPSSATSAGVVSSTSSVPRTLSSTKRAEPREGGGGQCGAHLLQSALPSCIVATSAGWWRKGQRLCVRGFFAFFFVLASLLLFFTCC